MDDRSLERDLEAIHPACFGWALTCCGWNRDQAEEALQASYVKALEGKARFDGHSSLRTWFFGVVKRTAAEQRRCRFARKLVPDRWLARQSARLVAPNPETLSREAEERRRLRECLVVLPERQRDLLHLVFYQEMTVEASAETLGISLGTARTHYERGKARLRKLLMRMENGDERKRRNRAAASRTVCGG